MISSASSFLFKSLFNNLFLFGRDNRELLLKLRNLFKEANNTSRRIQELILRSISETDISSLANSAIGDILRSLFLLFCYDSMDEIGTGITPFLAEILKYSKEPNLEFHDSKSSYHNSNSNSNSNSNHNGNDMINSSKKNVLNHEVDIASNAILTALTNISNVQNSCRTIPALLDRCNLPDTISFMRGRLMETRLQGVQNGILGASIISLVLSQFFILFPFNYFTVLLLLPFYLYQT